MDGQGTKWRRKIAENFNRLSRAHERYRQTTDGRAIAYSEREREFTFAKTLPAWALYSCECWLLLVSTAFISLWLHHVQVRPSDDQNAPLVHDDDISAWLFVVVKWRRNQWIPDTRLELSPLTGSVRPSLPINRNTGENVSHRVLSATIL